MFRDTDMRLRLSFANGRSLLDEGRCRGDPASIQNIGSEGSRSATADEDEMPSEEKS